MFGNTIKNDIFSSSKILHKSLETAALTISYVKEEQFLNRLLTTLVELSVICLMFFYLVFK